MTAGRMKEGRDVQEYQALGFCLWVQMTAWAPAASLAHSACRGLPSTTALGRGCLPHRSLRHNTSRALGAFQGVWNLDTGQIVNTVQRTCWEMCCPAHRPWPRSNWLEVERTCGLAVRLYKLQAPRLWGVRRFGFSSGSRQHSFLLVQARSWVTGWVCCPVCGEPGCVSGCVWGVTERRLEREGGRRSPCAGASQPKPFTSRLSHLHKCFWWVKAGRYNTTWLAVLHVGGCGL